jgi:hypothetical protein
MTKRQQRKFRAEVRSFLARDKAERLERDRAALLRRLAAIG